MYPLSAQVFYATAADVQKMRVAIVEFTGANQNPHALVTEADAQIISGILRALAEEIAKFDCRTALSTVRKFGNGIDNNTLTYAGATELIDELDGRIRDELEFVTAFTLTAQEANMVNPHVALISQEFFDKFPKARYDTEECAKCLAYGRSTAAVFHAMRIVELSVSAVARSLSIPEPARPADKTWGKILGTIKDKMDEKWPTVADREDGDGQAFEDIYALLRAIKNAWRNKTMHPARKYTEEEAAKIVNVSTHFLIELAKRMDEDGNPLA